MADRASDTELIRVALALAVRGLAAGDVPIGAVVVSPDGVTIGEGWNAREASADPSWAELLSSHPATPQRARLLREGRGEGCGP